MNDLLEVLLNKVDEKYLLEIANLVESRFKRYQRQRCHYSLYRQIALYREAIRLANEGLQYYEVAKILGVRKSTIYFWLNRGHKPWTSFKLPPINFELGYVIGSGIGDGSIADDGRMLVYSWLKDEDFADTIVRCVEELGIYAHKWYKRNWQVMITNTTIAELVWIGKKHPRYLIPIMSSDINAIKGVLTGWFDSDGTSGTTSEKYRYDAPHAFSISREVVKTMGILLDILGIHYTIGYQRLKEFISPQTGKEYKPKSEKIYQLRIKRCCTIRFSKEIGFKITRKRYALERLIERSTFKDAC